MDESVYDMSLQSESNPNIFIKKDWISILDNQNGVYSGNQCVIDTSQLSNSNKWLNYRESYILVPLMLSLGCTTSIATVAPATAGTSLDNGLSLKNWYGSIIHSIALDINGSTVIQQTPFQSLWNTFKLITTLSFQDVLTFGPTIGFYPDNSSSVKFYSAAATNGIGTCNNSNLGTFPVVSAAFNANETFNRGIYERQRKWNFDSDAVAGVGGDAFTTLMTQSNLTTQYRSCVIKKQTGNASTLNGFWQCQIQSTIFLKHLHSFFDKIPLCKGIFMKLTLMLNNTTTNFATGASQVLSISSVSSPLGGVNPLMLTPTVASNGLVGLPASLSYIANVSVGADCLETTLKGSAFGPVSGPNRNITLNCPAYTFNPVFESAYVSNAVRRIEYTDIYQFQSLAVSSGANFNSLITNGICGLKSVLVLPYYSATANAGTSPLLSPFDPAGGGPTSPLCYLNNFNVIVSGQNAIYNSERYTYEHFINQLYGQNSLNGNQISGINSGLINQLDFEMCYNYYYVNVERCLPIEKGVSKSVSIIGTNTSAKQIDLYVFCEYNCSVDINILLGVRV